MRSLYPKCRKLAESEAFQSATLLFILVMAAAMGLDTVPELAGSREAWFTGVELVAQVFFVFEIMVRVLASGPKLVSFFKTSPRHVLRCVGRRSLRPYWLRDPAAGIRQPAGAAGSQLT